MFGALDSISWYAVKYFLPLSVDVIYKGQYVCFVAGCNHSVAREIAWI